MHTIDLSSLNLQQLKQLLAAARARGQGDLAARLTAELKARRALGPGRPGVSVVRSFDEAGLWDEGQAPEVEPEFEDEAPRLRRTGWIWAAGLVALILAAGGWWWSQRPVLDAPTPIAQAPAPAVPASDPPPPLVAAVLATPPSEPVKAAVRAAQGDTAACRTQPTPADRLVCASPDLAVRHRRLGEAYQRALNAGADPAAMALEQAAWRARRDPVADKGRLARLYEARIRGLQAKTDALRAEEPPH